MTIPRCYASFFKNSHHSPTKRGAAMRGQVFRGTPESMALWQPYIGSKMLQKRGAPVGIRSELADVMWLHPFTLPGNSISILIKGKKGWGKSTFAKSMALRTCNLQAYNVLKEPEPWRVRITTRKSEEGAAEYRPVLDAMHANNYSLGHGNRINLLGLLRRLTDMINVAINIVQEIGKRRDDSKVSVAITIAVTKLYEQNPKVVGEELIKLKLRTLEISDFIDYFQSLRDDTYKRFEAEFKEDPKLAEQLGFNNNEFPHVDGSFVEAARHAAACFDELTGSSYGDVFGGKDSLYDVLTQRFVMLDTEDIPDNASAMLEAVQMKAEASAIRYSREDIGSDQDMTRIVPHLSIHDEEGGAMNSLMHARYTANKQNKSRAYGTSDWYLAQYDYQISEAGSTGSEMRKLAKEIRDGFDTQILFRQPNDDESLHALTKMGLSDSNAYSTTQQDVGQATLFVQGYPTVSFQHLLFEAEVPLVQTDSSRQRGARSTPVWTQDEAKRRLELAASRGLELQSTGL
jgi:hypothetical protein